jgi:DNA-binding PadR family transcriptional regulator
MKQPWFYILMSLASSDRYGSAIQEDVRELSGGEVRLWPVTLYGSLEALVERGWIRELDAGEQPEVGRGRERFYRIRQEGRDALSAEVRRMEDMARTARERLVGGAAEA